MLATDLLELSVGHTEVIRRLGIVDFNLSIGKHPYRMSSYRTIEWYSRRVINMT